jgi:hypothetical protein
MITLFYSKYSGNCKALFQYMKNANLMDKLDIKFINIDNQQVRNVVMKKFNVVPAIVVLDKDEISLYSGENAFDWFYNLTIQDESKPKIQQEEEEKEEEQEEKKPSDSKAKSIMELALEISNGREQIKE